VHVAANLANDQRQWAREQHYRIAARLIGEDRPNATKITPDPKSISFRIFMDGLVVSMSSWSFGGGPKREAGQRPASGPTSDHRVLGIHAPASPLADLDRTHQAIERPLFAEAKRQIGGLP
jgi:hypothetical protein